MTSFIRIVLTLLLLGFVWPVQGAELSPSTVTLAWDLSPTTNGIPNTYKVYWGVATRTYTNSVSAGTNLMVSVTNLARGSTYYFAATALATNGFDTNLLESDFSNEASWASPLPPAIPSTFRIITAN
jgi:hypothetical protein